MGNELSPRQTKPLNKFNKTFNESKNRSNTIDSSNGTPNKFTSFTRNTDNSNFLSEQRDSHQYISKPANTVVKTIFVENENRYRIQIPILADEEKNLTCGWLMSETIRKFTEMNLKLGYVQNLSNIMALKTKDELYTVDHWLTLFERPISVLTDKMILQPFYGDSKFDITRQKIGLTYFDILKLIGGGGFS